MACGTHNSGLINSPCLLAANISLQFDARPTNLAGFRMDGATPPAPPLPWNCRTHLVGGGGNVTCWPRDCGRSLSMVYEVIKRSYRAFNAFFAYPLKSVSFQRCMLGTLKISTVSLFNKFKWKIFFENYFTIHLTYLIDSKVKTVECIKKKIFLGKCYKYF